MRNWTGGAFNSIVHKRGLVYTKSRQRFKGRAQTIINTWVAQWQSSYIQHPVNASGKCNSVWSMYNKLHNNEQLNPLLLFPNTLSEGGPLPKTRNDRHRPPLRQVKVVKISQFLSRGLIQNQHETYWHSSVITENQYENVLIQHADIQYVYFVATMWYSACLMLLLI